jgi:predicted HTH transcriptional regulator
MGPTHKSKDGSKNEEEQKSPLENIVEMLNQQFGYDIDEEDKTFIKQLTERLESNESLKKTVEKNSREKAQTKFRNVSRKEMLDMIDQNTEFFNKATNDDEFAEVFQSWLFNHFKESSQKDIRGLIEDEQGKTTQFVPRVFPEKESNEAAKERLSQHACAFANTAGGHIIIGVSEEGNVEGLKRDFKSNSGGQEGIQTQISNALEERLGEKFAAQKTEVSFDTIGDDTVCLISVESSDEPITLDEDEFYVRDGTETQQLSSRDKEEYIRRRFDSK